MTKISNAGSNIWNLLDQPAVSKIEGDPVEDQ